ncbi:MAG: 5'-methylthioadenosine/S-adenosylhomocysteine nucleosidase [Slackia sp.]|nr:5'-methylthioadenosine/S-adenosylhomocysteine nucleosidase [Slackia sp.]
MAIGIVCATKTEVTPFLEKLEGATGVKRAAIDVYEGEFAGEPVVLTCCGVGKTNAAMACQMLIDRYEVEGIVNAGTAGGMAPEAGLFDIVVGTTFAHHDVDAQMVLIESYPYYPSGVFSADGELMEAARAAAQRSEGIVRFGSMVSGEQFIDDAQRGDVIARHDPLAVDMESAAMAQACFANGVAFVSVRGITDTAEHDGFGNYEINSAKASVLACDFTESLVKAFVNQG